MRGHWNALIQVHVPKTGGTALWHAIRGLGIQRVGHSKPIPVQGPRGPFGPGYIVTVRDPVARFVSAHANMLAAGMPLARPGWKDVATMAREWQGNDKWPEFPAGRHPVPFPTQVVYEPQVEWVYSAARLREPDIVMVLVCERLDVDFERLKRELGVTQDIRLPQPGDKKRNARDTAMRLPDDAVANLRSVYAEDVAMYEEVTSWASVSH